MQIQLTLTHLKLKHYDTNKHLKWYNIINITTAILL